MRCFAVAPLSLPLVSLLVVGGACSGGSSGPDAGPPDANPFCIEAAQHEDLAWLQENVITPSCARFTACHQGRATEAGGMTLEEGKVISSLVNVDSKLFGPMGTVMHGTWKRVVPGDPDHS